MLKRLAHWYTTLSPQDREWLSYAIIILFIALLPVLGLLAWWLLDRLWHPEFYLLFLQNLNLTLTWWYGMILL